MQSLRIEPSVLGGRILIQPSKSMAHRLLIGALLADGRSVIDNVVLSDDIKATINACKALGASISIEKSARFHNRRRVVVESGGKVRVDEPEINCNESGTTARFLIPVSRLCKDPVVFSGNGKLVARPFEVYRELLPGRGVEYSDENGKMPIRLSGRLNPGEYVVKGDVSSQFISGLLFALPCLEGDSTVKISGSLESRSYVEMTLQAIGGFGVKISHDEGSGNFFIPGGQKYRATDCVVEGDWSQAAFFCVIGAISGNMEIDGLSMESLQGDKVIVDIVKRMGAAVRTTGGTLDIGRSELKAIEVDASQCPDLVPAVAVGLALCEGKSVICNAARLRLKESDRLHSICMELNRIGACVEELPDGLVIHGVGCFKGNTVEGWNDHRVVMALAAASSACDGPIVINGSNAVAKSYPEFWEDLRMLGGRLYEQHMG